LLRAGGVSSPGEGGQQWRDFFGLQSRAEANFFDDSSQDPLQSPAYATDTDLAMHAIDTQRDFFHRYPYFNDAPA
jgi:hypothetical protein